MSVAAAKAWARLAMRLYALQAKRILSGLACEALRGFSGNLRAIWVFGYAEGASRMVRS